VARIVTGYDLKERGVSSSPGRSRILSSPLRPHRLWGPLSVLSSGYPGALSLNVKRQGREENVDLYVHSPIRLHGIVLT
jgi:hypothetical protein